VQLVFKISNLRAHDPPTLQYSGVVESTTIFLG